MDRRVQTREGRVLAVADCGEPSWPAILSIHGSGMGRTFFPPYLADAAARQVRVISYDRPGLGGSTRHVGYRIVDCADDVRAIAEALDLERLGVWGISAGSAYALACAARLKDLVWAVASVEGVAPAEPPLPDDDPWIDVEAKRAEYAEAAAADFERAATREGVIESYFSESLCPADVAALRGAVGAWFAEDARDALAGGGDGWFDEGYARAHDWGFELADIDMPVLVFHGRKDTWVEPDNATRLAAAIPKAQLRLTDDDGHLSLVNRLPEVTDWLLSQRS